eukprot:scaffold17460_cov128-Isochrysis_galbana.AAC.7
MAPACMLQLRQPCTPLFHLPWEACAPSLRHAGGERDGGAASDDDLPRSDTLSMPGEAAPLATALCALLSAAWRLPCALGGVDIPVAETHGSLTMNCAHPRVSEASGSALACAAGKDHNTTHHRPL